MKTIKLPITTDDNNNIITNIQKIQNNIIRISYKLLTKNNNLSIKDIEKLLKKYKINTNDSYIIRCGILKGIEIFKQTQDIQSKINEKAKKLNKIPKLYKHIFGGKTNYYKRLLNKITPETYKNNRLIPLQIQGEANQKGNRKFNLNITNNQITFKLSKNTKINIQLPQLSKKSQWFKLISKLQTLANNKQIPYMIQLSQNYIWITFDNNKLSETIKNIPITNRIMGIDLNPNYIAFTISDIIDNKPKTLAKYCYNISQLTKNLHLPSDHPEQKYQTNKRNYETSQIIKNINKFFYHYNVSHITVEDLSFSNNFNNKKQNRLCKNSWAPNKFIQQLKNNNKNIIEIHPAYTSFIGNLMYNEFDPVAASLEIGRRGYDKINKSGMFYPPVCEVKDQWKKTLAALEKPDWKELYNQITKTLDLRYRVPLDDTHVSSRLKTWTYKKAQTSLYSFI
jgi:hypothetical protein